MLGNPIQFIDADGMSVDGHYYSSDGQYLGNDGIDDDKVYLVTGNNIDKMSLDQILSTSSNPIDGATSLTTVSELNMSHSELNMRVMLSVIRTTEGHGTPLNYDSQFGNNTITNYKSHPNKSIKAWGHTSTAAGAYQFLSGTWSTIASQIGAGDFSPSNQDLAAVARIDWKNGATEAIKSGDFNSAISKLNGVWTSLPGGKHQWANSNTTNLVNEYLVKELNDQSIINTPQGELLSN